MSDNKPPIPGMWGLGLSHFLRYSYGGFLFLVLAALLEPQKTRGLIEALMPGVACVAAIVIGAGIYVFHRYIVIPFHHLGLCLLFLLHDCKHRKSNNFDKIISPTGYLNKKFKVPRCRRILAYSVLRRSDFFPNTAELDVAHAENGLLVMTASGCLIASIYAWRQEEPLQNPWVLFAFFVVSLAASYIAGRVQHSAECLVIKKKENECKVRLTLERAGIIEVVPVAK